MANISRQDFCHILRNIFRKYKICLAGESLFFSEIRKAELLGEDRFKIPGKLRLCIRYSSMTGVMFRERIRSTKCIMVSLKL